MSSYHDNLSWLDQLEAFEHVVAEATAQDSEFTRRELSRGDRMRSMHDEIKESLRRLQRVLAKQPKRGFPSKRLANDIAQLCLWHCIPLHMDEEYEEEFAVGALELVKCLGLKRIPGVNGSLGSSFHWATKALLARACSELLYLIQETSVIGPVDIISVQEAADILSCPPKSIEDDCRKFNWLHAVSAILSCRNHNDEVFIVVFSFLSYNFQKAMIGKFKEFADWQSKFGQVSFSRLLPLLKMEIAQALIFGQQIRPSERDADKDMPFEAATELGSARKPRTSPRQLAEKIILEEQIEDRHTIAERCGISPNYAGVILYHLRRKLGTNPRRK